MFALLNKDAPRHTCYLLLASLVLLSQGCASLGHDNALPANLEDQLDFPLGTHNLS